MNTTKMDQLFQLDNNNTIIPNMSHHENLLYGCDGQITNTIPPLEIYILTTIMFITILLSLFGNTLVILAIYRNKLLQTPTNAILCSLAVTDVLGPALRLFSLSVAMLRNRWDFGCTWCVMSSTLGIFFGASSINHLCLISIERCITIKYPYKSSQFITKVTVSIATGLVWVISLLSSLFPFFGIGFVAFQPHLLDCEVYLKHDPMLGFLLGCVYFIFPFVVMVIVYTLILYSVRKQVRKMRSYTLGSQEDKHKQEVKTEMKALKTVMVVVGFFFFFWLPYFVTSALAPYMDISAEWKRCSFVMAYMNSCCNWIVYSVRNKQMRKAFKNILHLN